jgi:hypothetical protein
MTIELMQQLERERDAAREDAERLAEALKEIDGLPKRWDAPLSHPCGDMSDPAYRGAAAWAVVGSAAHLIAHKALGGSLDSARAALASCSVTDEGETG